MLTPKRILAEIDKLSIAYPAAKLSEKQKAALTVIWMEDLGNLTEAMFVEAVRHARRGSRFFPSTCDVLNAAKEVAAAATINGIKAIPERSASDILESREKGKTMLEGLRKAWGIAPGKDRVQ